MTRSQSSIDERRTRIYWAKKVLEAEKVREAACKGSEVRDLSQYDPKVLEYNLEGLAYRIGVEDQETDNAEVSDLLKLDTTANKRVRC